VTKPRAFYDGAWPPAFPECPAQEAISTEVDTAGARHRDVGLAASSRLRNPATRAVRIPGMRLILLAFPVIVTVLMLVACGGKGGGGGY
jgi:hypothetical protein